MKSGEKANFEFYTTKNVCSVLDGARRKPTLLTLRTAAAVVHFAAADWAFIRVLFKGGVGEFIDFAFEFFDAVGW